MKSLTLAAYKRSPVSLAHKSMFCSPCCWLVVVLIARDQPLGMKSRGVSLDYDIIKEVCVHTSPAGPPAQGFVLFPGGGGGDIP